MFSAIISLLGSNVFGSLIGWVGGWLNRRVDLETKRLELEHELKMRNADLELVKAEAEGNFKVAEETAAGQIESSAYAAIAAGYEGQFSKSGFGWVDAVTRLIRPIVTVIFVLASLGVSFYILSTAFSSGTTYTLEEWKQWITYVLQWIFFQAGVVIGWWFANRPSHKRTE